MHVTLYGIPNCDTVKKARAALATAGVTVAFHDFKKAGVPPQRLHAWAAAHGWDALINRQGSTWRQLPPADQARAGEPDGAAQLLSLHSSLIKRPVIEWPEGRITLGYKPQDWPLVS